MAAEAAPTGLSGSNICRGEFIRLGGDKDCRNSMVADAAQTKKSGLKITPVAGDL